MFILSCVEKNTDEGVDLNSTDSAVILSDTQSNLNRPQNGEQVPPPPPPPQGGMPSNQAHPENPKAIEGPVNGDNHVPASRSSQEHQPLLPGGG